MRAKTALVWALGLLLSCGGSSCQSKQNVLAPTDSKKLGEQIRQARLRKELSQQALADSLRISSEVLSLIEDGFASPLPAILERIELQLDTQFVQDTNLF